MSTASSTSSLVQRLKRDLDEKVARQAAESEQALLPATGSGGDESIVQSHVRRARTREERERVSMETAKKMAARFNLSFRAQALQNARRLEEEHQRDMKERQKAKTLASRYQMTARALRMASTGTAKGKINVSIHRTSQTEHRPSVVIAGTGGAPAGGMYSLPVTSTSIYAEAAPSEPGRRASAAPSRRESAVAPASSPPPAVVKTQEDASLDKEDNLSRITETTEDNARHSPKGESDAFWMAPLARALEVKDDAAINVAVVESFLSENDPERVSEAAALLQAHKGREDELMTRLVEEYPSLDEVVVGPDAAVETPDYVGDEVVYTSERDKLGSSGRHLMVELDAQGGSGALVDAGGLMATGGFILSGVRQSPRKDSPAAIGKGQSQWAVNPPKEDVKARAVLERTMSAKGQAPSSIAAVIQGGDLSEMM